MTDHKATPEQWTTIERLARNDFYNPSTILELRARVEALEANSKPTPNPSQIRSSLVERLRKARHTAAVLGNDQDRAAIREVAEWLALNGWVYASALLRQEALPDD
jgi:hypothetical protein